MKSLDSIAFMLIEGDRVLAEKRDATKKIYPGVIALPGGYIEDGESPEDALRRESKEELDIVPRSLKYVCTLLFRWEELWKIHYFAIETWEGNIKNNEKQSLTWFPLSESHKLDIDVDRIALSEYLRINTT